jgi:adenylate cyclase
VAGLLIGLFLAAFELFFVQTPAGAWLRRLPLILFIIVAVFIWSLLIGFSIYIATPVLLGIDLYLHELDARDVNGLIFAFGLALLSTFFLRVRSLIGGRVLFNFFIGRYHKPAHDERVFMFLDIADSTRLSEQFGDVKIQALIGRFFFDIARPIAERGGETYRYIGDELVVTWPFQSGIRGARCVKCAVEITALVRNNAEHYRNAYGEAPRLRIALHGGFVVVSEIGDDRREIVYFGDTVNTAARLRGLAKKIQRGLVISAALLEHTSLPDGVSAEDMGAFALSGKAQSTRVYAVHGRIG